MSAEEVRSLLYLYDERQWLQKLMQSGHLEPKTEARRQVLLRLVTIEQKISALESGEAL